MTMDAQHLDGNGIAGLLGEIAGAEMTTMLRTCQSCGDRRALGEHRSYRSAGVVLRCPSCSDVALVVGVHEERLVVGWRGTYEIGR
jgi:ribosomal protein S27AE